MFYVQVQHLPAGGHSVGGWAFPNPEAARAWVAEQLDCELEEVELLIIKVPAERASTPDGRRLLGEDDQAWPDQAGIAGV